MKFVNKVLLALALSAHTASAFVPVPGEILLFNSVVSFAHLRKQIDLNGYVSQFQHL